MPALRLLPDDLTTPIAPGESVLAASLRAGVPHTHVCGGQARCSTCRVRVETGTAACAPRTPAESRLAGRLGFPEDIRLACQLRVTGDVAVRRLVLDEVDRDLTSQLGRSAAERVGVEQRLAILFADIRGFTPLAESLPAYDVVHLLNRHFARMEAAVRAEGGTVDNLIGDGLLALFGVGEPDTPDVALRAVRAGLAMVTAFEEVNGYLQLCFARRVRLGVGIHWGEAVVGSIGGATRRVTAIGDAVNLASRIESATRATGAACLISDAVYAALPGRLAVSAVHDLALPGKQGTYRLYAVEQVLPSGPAVANAPGRVE